MPYFKPRSCKYEHMLTIGYKDGKKIIYCSYCDYYEYSDW